MTGQLTFKVRRDISASHTAVWEVIGDFGNEHRWARSITRCERDTDVPRVGTVRTCMLPRPLMGRTQVREQIIELDVGSVLAYELDGPAGPFKSAKSRWSTMANPDGATLVSVEGIFQARNRFAELVLWPLAKPVIRRLTDSVLGELQSFLEGAKH